MSPSIGPTTIYMHISAPRVVSYDDFASRKENLNTRLCSVGAVDSGYGYGGLTELTQVPRRFPHKYHLLWRYRQHQQGRRPHHNTVTGRLQTPLLPNRRHRLEPQVASSPLTCSSATSGSSSTNSYLWYPGLPRLGCRRRQLPPFPLVL